VRGTCLAPLTDNSKDIDWIARFHHHQVGRSKSIAVSTMRRREGRSVARRNAECSPRLSGLIARFAYLQMPKILFSIRNITLLVTYYFTPTKNLQ